MTSKTLLIFCDGTGQDGSLVKSLASYSKPSHSGSATQATPTAAQATPAAAQATPAATQATPAAAQAIPAAPQVAPVAHQATPAAPQVAPVAHQATPAAPQGVAFASSPAGTDGQSGIPFIGQNAATISNAQYATNVIRLARSVKVRDAHGNSQIVYYQSGVGSETDFEGDSVVGSTAMQALGTAVASKIRDAYVFIAQNYEDGDKICLFGFSRGAYTARKLSGLIDRIGLLTVKHLGRFFEIWSQLVDKKTLKIPSDTRHPDIQCVAVWDTVGSLDANTQINALNIADTSLPKSVKVALHALSLHENRHLFLPTLWSTPQGELNADQTLKQVWFAGAHSDVGGGYQRHELADISLYWMAGELKALGVVDLDYTFLRSYAQVKPDTWGTSQPHNSYEEASWDKQLVFGHETRLESKQIDKNAVFHESVKTSPLRLTSPTGMITMADIQKKFGSGYVSQYAPMNEFEKFCRDKWGTEPTYDHGTENPHLIIKQQ